MSEKEMSIKNSWQILLGTLITAGQSSQHEIADHVDMWRTCLQKSLGRNDLVTSEAPGRKCTGWGQQWRHSQQAQDKDYLALKEVRKLSEQWKQGGFSGGFAGQREQKKGNRGMIQGLWP